MRRLIDDPDAREEPLEILKEKISVFEEAEHAQVHAHARDQPAAFCMSILRFANLPTEPEIHCGGGEKQRGKRWIPCAVKNVTGDDEQVFPQRPRSDAPVERDDHYKEDDESERIKQHDESAIELRCRMQHRVYASHIEAGFLDVVLSACKIRTASSGGAMFYDPLTSILSLRERKEKRIAGLAFRLSLRERKPSAGGERAFVL